MASISSIRITKDDDIIQKPQKFFQFAGPATVPIPAGHTSILVEGGGGILLVVVTLITDDVTLDEYHYYLVG